MRKNWTYTETLLALNLYLKTPYGKIHTRNPDIINLAELLGRSPNAVSLKLANIASLDPELKKTGQKGFSHRSKLDEQIWEEYEYNPEELAFKSETLWIEFASSSKPGSIDLDEKILHDSIKDGIEKEAVIKQRVNQGLFRKRLLAIYNCKCPVTGIDEKRLLLASHIVPWSVDTKNRLNPRNGILLSALWDKAFDSGLITFSQKHEIIISSTLEGTTRDYFSKFNKQKVVFSENYPPEREFLEYHEEVVFLG